MLNGDVLIVDRANDHREKCEQETQRDFRIMELGKRLHFAIKNASSRELYSEAEKDIVTAQECVTELQQFVEDARKKLVSG